jgi:hypothetical protein
MKHKMLPGIVGICLVLVNSSCVTSKVLFDFAKVRLFGGYYSYALNTAIQEKGPEEVKELLEEGADPNYTEVVSIWAESNPLSVLQMIFYDSYTYKKRGELSDPQPEILVFNYLRDAGADIHKLPYIWLRVHTWGERDIKVKMRNHYDTYGHPPEELQENIESFVVSVNQLIKALLEAGADPDMRGHPYPFSREVKPKDMSYEKARVYFNRGTRAINEAIRKGMIWESQVDLLLEYTSLDEDSLTAAEKSGDPAMKEKIRRLWEAGHSEVSP